MSDTHDLEVQFKGDSGKAVIEGKTAVSFQTFITLVLQRKVLNLTKHWGKESIVVSSELLSAMASAPQDSRQNLGHFMTVCIGVGVVAGVALLAMVQIVLWFLEIPVGIMELSYVAGGVVGLGILVWILSRMQKTKKSERVLEAMESLSGFLGK